MQVTKNKYIESIIFLFNVYLNILVVILLNDNNKDLMAYKRQCVNHNHLDKLQWYT